MTPNNSRLKEAFKAWLPFAVIIVIFAGLVYGAVQQNYRQSANDPQIQVAEDIATAVSLGQAAPDTIVSAEPTTDIAQSLSTFVVMYSATGTPIGSSVSVNGKMPTLPAGVADYTSLHDQDRFTWEPEPGVRIAAVVSHFAGPVPGFVLAGRSIKEIEIRENNLAIMCAVAAVVALVLLFLMMFFACPGKEVLYRSTETTVEEVVAEDKPV